MKYLVILVVIVLSFAVADSLQKKDDEVEAFLQDFYRSGVP